MDDYDPDRIDRLMRKPELDLERTRDKAPSPIAPEKKRKERHDENDVGIERNSAFFYK